jgi:CTP synthase (UTP-ammonia lyase)
MIRIGVMGDKLAGVPAHDTIESALSHAAIAAHVPLSADWIPTSVLKSDAAGALSRFDGLFAGPGTPEAVHGALEGIRYAREHDAVLVGTCGGFQHAVLKFAKNVAGIVGAAHQDYEPDADALVLTALTCSIAGTAMRVVIEPGTRAHEVFQTSTTMEEYYCNYGINPKYEQTLLEHGLVISGRDEDGEPRILELPTKRFFMASLFVPQVRSTPSAPHPLLVAFVRAAAAVAARRERGSGGAPAIETRAQQ